MIGGLFSIFWRVREREWDGMRGRESGGCGMGFGRGGGLDISQVWVVLLLMILEVRHVMAYMTQLEIRLGLSYLSGFCT